MAGESALTLGALALTVHGPSGIVDIVVPADAQAVDVAREYAAACRLPEEPVLRTRRGETLAPADTLSARGVVSGSVLAADGPVALAPRPRRRLAVAVERAGGLSALVAGVAAALALYAGWAGAHADGLRQQLLVVLLALGAATGLVPTGAYAPRRAVVAPAFAGAAAFALVWSPEPERLPTVIGVAALVAAVVAAAVRAVDTRAEEALRVWIITGASVFVVTAACALLGFAPQVAWALLLVAAVLAARLVPSYAVDVPDSYLIDLERLAVTAWSARVRPAGRRQRTIVPLAAVSEVAGRGARTLAAAAWAVLALAVVAAPLLLATATRPIDRVGARVVVLAGGAALLLAARSYRYWLPRGLLRIAGIVVTVAGLVAALRPLDDGLVVALGLVAVVLGVVLVAVAIATGRGWRSVWWAARADLAEALAGATAVGALVVAAGIFRHLWESGLSV